MVGRINRSLAGPPVDGDDVLRRCLYLAGSRTSRAHRMPTVWGKYLTTLHACVVHYYTSYSTIVDAPSVSACRPCVFDCRCDNDCVLSPAWFIVSIVHTIVAFYICIMTSISSLSPLVGRWLCVCRCGNMRMVVLVGVVCPACVSGKALGRVRL